MPDVTIDEESLIWSSTSISGTGKISYGNDSIQVSYVFYGDFSFYSIYSFENSNLYSTYLTLPNLGSYSIQNINLTFKVLAGDPNYVELLLIQNDDYITATNYGDYINASTGNDDVFGNGGNDIIFGGDGNDTISGGSGNDIIYGGTGNDILQGGYGNDKIDGDIGNDTIYFSENQFIKHLVKGGESLKSIA